MAKKLDIRKGIESGKIHAVIDQVVRDRVKGVDVIRVKVDQGIGWDGDLLLRIDVIFKSDGDNYVSGQEAYGLGYYIGKALEEAAEKDEIEADPDDLGFPILSYVADEELKTTKRAPS